MEENGYKIGIEARLTKVETKLDDLISNHLPHIQRAIEKVNNKIWAAILALVGNLIGLIFLLVRTFFEK